jgi:hypothetical protein
MLTHIKIKPDYHLQRWRLVENDRRVEECGSGGGRRRRDGTGIVSPLRCTAV